MNKGFEGCHKAALLAGKKADETEPRAVPAKYDSKSKHLVINLHSGATLLLPTKLVEGFESATVRELSAVEILGNGSALHWGDLDVDLSVPHLLMGLFGTKSWMSKAISEIGRVGGSQKTEAIAKSSRRNGKLGGRPILEPGASSPDRWPLTIPSDFPSGFPLLCTGHLYITEHYGVS